MIGEEWVGNLFGAVVVRSRRLLSVEYGSLSVVGELPLSVRYEHNVTEIRRVLVVEEAPFAFVLGQDWLERSGAFVGVRSGSLVIHWPQKATPLKETREPMSGGHLTSLKERPQIPVILPHTHIGNIGTWKRVRPCSPYPRPSERRFNPTKRERFATTVTKKKKVRGCSASLTSSYAQLVAHDGRFAPRLPSDCTVQISNVIQSIDGLLYTEEVCPTDRPPDVVRKRRRA